MAKNPYNSNKSNKVFDQKKSKSNGFDNKNENMFENKKSNGFDTKNKNMFDKKK